MTNDKQARKLEQVRALLAKADSTNFPEEADTFRAKADELMTSYAIEAWMVEEGQESGRPVPESREFDMAWYWSHDRGDDLWSLMNGVAYHCRVKLIYWSASRKVPAVGLPADLDYFDLLFTQLMLELVKRIEPQPDPRESVEQNGYRLRSAGCRWPRATQLLWTAGMLEAPRGHEYWMEDQLAYAPVIKGVPWSQLRDKTKDALKNKLAQRVRTYRRAEGLPDYTSVHPEVYARSFAQGFVSEIKARFRAMRRATDGPGSGDGNPAALALLDIRKVVDNAAGEMFGAPPKATGRSVSRQVRFDSRAYGNGASEGKKVQLSNSPNARVGSRKGLTR